MSTPLLAIFVWSEAHCGWPSDREPWIRYRRPGGPTSSRCIAPPFVGEIEMKRGSAAIARIPFSVLEGTASACGLTTRTFESVIGSLRSGAFVAMLVFLLLLVEGLAWAWQKGVLTWK